MSRTSGSGGWVKIKLASDGNAAIDRLLLLAVVQQKNEEERVGNLKVSNFPPLVISYFKSILRNPTHNCNS